MTERASPPRFSLVTAVFNVEPYLPDFIESIESQRVATGDIEVIAVDDGSSDRSLELLRDWATRSSHVVKVLTQPNAGQGAARNLGLDHATGDWVGFPDPDDILDPGFLHVAGAFAARHPRIELLASKPILYLEQEQRLSDTHPRWRQYEPRNRVADLDREPNVFPGSASVSLYRRDRLVATNLRFDHRVRPNFEDGHFAVRFLFGLESPRVGLLRDAHYLYRKRAAGTSTLQRSLSDPGRYTSVLEHGYLDVLDAARERYGHVPAWLQQVIVYELSWYLGEDEKVSSAAFVAPEIQPRFHELLERIVLRLDPEVIAAHRVRRLRPLWVDILSHLGRPEPWHSPWLVRTGRDRAMRLRRLQYRFHGPVPTESITVGGTPVEPAFAKTMAHRYYGRPLLYERILWVPAGRDVEVRIDGAALEIRRRWPVHPRRRRIGRAAKWARRVWHVLHMPRRRPAELAAVRVGRLRRAFAGPLLRRAASLPLWRRRFDRAWLVMDRIHDADDNGERLFEHLRRERPDINAWFTVEPGTADWHRLRATYGTRVLPHGSFTWKAAMLNAAWVLSSHADLAIYRPPQLAGTGEPTYRFGFLQHGVIKDDLSRWLNGRDVALFVVSTPAELASIAGDGTGYRFTRKETRETGLPRFDRLLELGRAVPRDGRNLIMVAPTWRQWLNLPLASGSQRRRVDDAFWDSDYIVLWTALLRSEAIAAAAASRGWTVGFMPHPNLQAALAQLDLPAHVTPLSFEGTDVQALYARCALLVTDYSSVAFNAAYLDRPTVYFQFDRDRMLGGAHVGRAGYYDYERDGFGPVTTELEAAEAAVLDAIRRGPEPTPEYLDRIRATFPTRDGQASARVVAALEELGRPWRRAPSASEADSSGP